ncbi:carbohydrate kinase [Dokdonia sp. Asnod2-E02]|uniref:carbohydrate kinase family protein n=1 Tax=Dokdonia sp. Asnod2-E02 TaxID=3160574 RepID=UPI003870ECBB
MPNTPLKIASYGEILWDVFPDEKRLGGAPLNVALRLHSFGVDVSMISSLGNDALGKEALALIKEKGLDTALIQRNDKATGQVKVTLDKARSASYEIAQDTAWDAIAWNEKNAEAVTAADALIIGSLAFRESGNILDALDEDSTMAETAVNLEAIEVLAERSKFTVFDLNLRAPHYDLEIVAGLMEAADMIKLNDEELELIVMAMGIEGDTLEDELKMLSAMTETPTVCVTLGSEGAMLYHKGGIHTQVGFPAKVVDTVGAGDSFLATLVFGLLSGETAEDALEVACAVGSLVAGKPGANPVVTNDEINNLLS